MLAKFSTVNSVTMCEVKDVTFKLSGFLLISSFVNRKLEPFPKSAWVHLPASHEIPGRINSYQNE